MASKHTPTLRKHIDANGQIWCSVACSCDRYITGRSLRPMDAMRAFDMHRASKELDEKTVTDTSMTHMGEQLLEIREYALSLLNGKGNLPDFDKILNSVGENILDILNKERS